MEKNHPLNVLRGMIFEGTEEQIAQNLTKIFSGLQEANVGFFGFVRKEGVKASWRNARYTNMN